MNTWHNESGRQKDLRSIKNHAHAHTAKADVLNSVLKEKSIMDHFNFDRGLFKYRYVTFSVKLTFDQDARSVPQKKFQRENSSFL